MLAPMESRSVSIPLSRDRLLLSCSPDWPRYNIDTNVILEGFLTSLSLIQVPSRTQMVLYIFIVTAITSLVVSRHRKTRRVCPRKKAFATCRHNGSFMLKSRFVFSFFFLSKSTDWRRIIWIFIWKTIHARRKHFTIHMVKTDKIESII